MALIEVRPIPQKKWHGKTGKESFKQPMVLEVLFDSQTGKYATGLTEEEAKKYGNILGADLSDTFSFTEPHPYYSTSTAKIRLKNQTMFFNDELASDFVKIKAMKASKFVANSFKELEAGQWPDATHVMYDETEEIEIKATKVQTKNKCVAIVAKMSADEKANIVQILSEKTVKKMTANFIDVAIDEIIDTKPHEFIRYAKMDKEEVYTRATLLEGIKRNILIKEGVAIYYMGERIANDLEEAVRWFLDPQNSKMKVAILEKMDFKK